MMSILRKIGWVFNNKEYPSTEDFDKAISKYQVDIMEERACWNAEEIVVDKPIVNIQYMVWIKGANDLTKNETLFEDEDFFENEDNSDNGMFQAEIVAQFKADNGKSFTALELMFKLHQQMQSKELGDHIFFEGLQETESSDDFPRFYLCCGS